MYSEGKNWRYVIGFGLLIVLLFIVIFMIVRGGGSDEAEVIETKRALTSYVSDANVTLVQTTVGPIVAAQNHTETQIRITNQNATLDVMQGYDGNVIASRTHAISTAAFGELLSALEKVGFTEGDTDKSLENDKGYCPTGERYIFEIREGSKTVQRFWSTSCRGDKTFLGSAGSVIALFQEQIPDYSEVTNQRNNPFDFGL